MERVYPERRIIVAEKKNGGSEGAYENMRRNGRVFRHMCFVSVELAARATDENPSARVCQQHRTTQRAARSGSQPQCDAFYRENG